VLTLSVATIGGSNRSVRAKLLCRLADTINKNGLGPNGIHPQAITRPENTTKEFSCLVENEVHENSRENPFVVFSGRVIAVELSSATVDVKRPWGNELKPLRTVVGA
jgi:hypothetical protein